MKSLGKIFLSFLKIGAIGFGGGSSLIPVVEEEIVEKNKWIKEEDYLKHTVIANITPGALPVKLGALAGYEKGGIFGSLLASYAISIPGVFLLILILSFLSYFGSFATKYIQFASVGIDIFIIYLLFSYIIKIIFKDKTKQEIKINILIALVAFLLTGGSELNYIFINALHIRFMTKIFSFLSLKTIDLMIISFFMILYGGIIKTKKSLIVGSFVSILYIIAISLENPIVILYINIKYIIILIMILLILYSLIKNHNMINRRKQNKEHSKVNIDKNILKAAVIHLSIPLILFIIFIIFDLSYINDILALFKNMIISITTDFGGGEAYVAVSNGLFVQGGYISENIFYNEILAIANALPGSILVKIAAAIAYNFGNLRSGFVYGLSLSIIVMSLATGVCSSVSLIMLTFYESFKESVALKKIKEYILPVICGMLIPIALKMIIQSEQIASKANISPLVSVFVIIISIISLLVISRKKHINDIKAILTFATASVFIIGFI